MNKTIEYKRGSEWRIWDLHIHTPNSINQNYGDSVEGWEKFISALENLPKEVKVIGITDYYFIDGYEKVMKFKAEGRLQNLEKIFPILEFRIDTFGSGNENNLQKVNLHVLFDLDESNLAQEIKKVKTDFIGCIKLSKDHQTKTLTRENLAEAGGTLQEGFSSIIPNTEEVFNIINDSSWVNKSFLFLGFKEWSNLQKNQQLKTLKEKLYGQVHAFLTSNYNGIEKSQKWLDELELKIGKKRLLHSLDIHGFDSMDTYEFNEIGNKLNQNKYYCNTWIKADPTFNGLKQIFYEPIERVEISQTKPEDKSGYRVIESVTIEHDDFHNEILYFNENLNSIIGGRSSGKSLLLGAIAKKLDSETSVKENLDYEKYVVSVSENLTIIWKDGQIDNNREIEYFPQNHMYSLANEGNKIDNLIDSIIRQDESKNNILNEYNSFCNNNFTEIANKIIKIFQIIDNIKKSKSELKLRGDEEGIKLEINKLNEELKILKSESVLTEIEIDKFNKLKTKLDILISEVKFHDIEISKISSLRLKLIFSDIEFELANLSKETRENLLEEYKNILKEYQEKWEQSTTKLLEKIQGLKKDKISEISKIENDIVYQKGVTSLKNNSSFFKLLKNLENQNEKLSEIKNIKNEIKELKFQFDEQKINTLKLHQQYFDEIKIIKDSLSENRNRLKINATSKINFESFFQLINRSINQQISKNQKYLSPEINNEEKYFEILETLFDEVLSENIILKGGYKLQQLCYELMTTNFFEIAYDIEYENDNFIQMSEGKKSFVVMMLLLDFSKKDCPILIDQPEDDLDNRAIYNDLVKYLKEKKKERQILLVTHNPNIVVGADSELVIVANQHGRDTPNDKNTKFQYISGSIENSHLNNTKERIILESQGIKEHVCEILEGGNAAFKKRELKYNIK